MRRKGVTNVHTDIHFQFCNIMCDSSKTLQQIQCAGEAKYAEDLPSLPKEVFAAFVLSTVAVGTIESIDACEALVSIKKNIRLPVYRVLVINSKIFKYVLVQL